MAQSRPSRSLGQSLRITTARDPLSMKNFVSSLMLALTVVSHTVPARADRLDDIATSLADFGYPLERAQGQYIMAVSENLRWELWFLRQQSMGDSRLVLRVCFDDFTFKEKSEVLNELNAELMYLKAYLDADEDVCFERIEFADNRKSEDLARVISAAMEDFGIAARIWRDQREVENDRQPAVFEAI